MSPYPVILQVANMFERDGLPGCMVGVIVGEDEVPNEIIAAIGNNFHSNTRRYSGCVYTAWNEVEQPDTIELAERIARHIRKAGYEVIIFNPKGYTFKEC